MEEYFFFFLPVTLFAGMLSALCSSKLETSINLAEVKTHEVTFFHAVIHNV